jgi:hypothetical protein
MKLLNFCIDGTNLEIAGQAFDLHNFHLRNYTHDTWNRVFKIALKGDLYCDNNQVTTDLKITFRNVSCLRIQDDPVDEKNVCFMGMQYVSEIDYKPDIAERLQAELLIMPIIAEAAVQLAQAEAEGETISIDWSTYMYIHFVWGVEVLIAAETVEVSFHQAVSLY